MASVILSRKPCVNGFIHTIRSAFAATRPSSHSYTTDLKVVSSSDGQTVVCWHPEPYFPYEKSLPVRAKECTDASSLKVQCLDDLRSVYQKKKDEFVRQELMDLTYTTKHRWFPESVHKRRRKRNFEQSRKYL